MDQGKLQERIKARRSAEEIIDFLEASAVGDTAHYWKIVDEYVKKQLPEKESKTAMSDVEANRFGYQLMPFGEFKGIAICNVKRARLDWYARQNEEFNSQLVRYLKNEKIASELRFELEGGLDS